MKRFRYSLIIIAMALLNLTCTHQRDGAALEISVKAVKIESWLNLMPGGAGSFHFSGEIKIKNNSSCEVDSLSLIKIQVTQNGNQIYSIIPSFYSKIAGESNELAQDTEKDFLFYTQSGLAINKELNMEIPIKLTMLFKEEDNSFLYEIGDLKIEKVY